MTVNRISSAKSLGNTRKLRLPTPANIYHSESLLVTLGKDVEYVQS